MSDYVVSISAWTIVDAESEEAASAKVIDAMNKDYEADHDKGVFFKDIEIEGPVNKVD